MRHGTRVHVALHDGDTIDGVLASDYTPGWPFWIRPDGMTGAVLVNADEAVTPVSELHQLITTALTELIGAP